MAEVAQIPEMIVEAAAFDDDIAMVVGAGQNNWVVRFAAMDVEIQLDPERRRLVLLTNIGVPNPERRLAVLEAVLVFNLLVLETGGVRIAMTATDGDIVQLVDLGIDDLTSHDLATVITNLAGRALVWRAFISAAAEDAPVPPGPSGEVVMFHV
jgi:Tir chaperone protein (CesT) family